MTYQIDLVGRPPKMKPMEAPLRVQGSFLRKSREGKFTRVMPPSPISMSGDSRRAVTLPAAPWEVN